MKLKNIIDGKKVYVKELDTWFTQPSIREIIKYEDAFMSMLHIFTISKNTLIMTEEIKDMDEYHLCLLLLYSNADENEISLNQFFSLILPEYKIVTINEQGLILSKSEGKVLIVNGMNFNILKEALVEIFYLRHSRAKDEFNPQGARAKAIADKLKKGRMKSSDNKGSKPLTLGDYATILTIGLDAYTLEEILNLTMYQLFILLERFTLNYNFSIDLKCRLAGGGSDDDHAEDWMKNLVE